MLTQSLFAYGYLPLFLIAFLLFAIGLLYLIIKPTRGDIKNNRYEAGNLPKGEARGKMGFQYFGYIALFASIEPIIIIIFLVSPVAKSYYNQLLTLMLFTLAIIFPILVYGLRQAGKPDYWRWR